MLHPPDAPAGHRAADDGRPPSRRLVTPRRVLLALLGLALVAFGTHRCDVVRGRRAYEKALAAIRAAGEPLTPADFAARYPAPPPDKDFRRLLRSCLPEGSSPLDDPAICTEPWFGQLRTRSDRARLDPGFLDELRGASLSNAPVIELLLQTDLTGFGLDHGWTNGLLSSYPDLHGDRIFLRIELARALAIQAVYEAETGHSDRAALSLARAFQVADLGQGGTLLGGVGNLACTALTLSVIERVLNTTPWTEESLRRLHEGLPQDYDTLRTALVGERAFQVYLWDLPQDVAVSNLGLSSPAGRPGLIDRGVRLLGKLRGYRARLDMLSRWNRRIAAMHLPPQQRIQAFAEVHAEVASLVTNANSPLTEVLQVLAIDPLLIRLLEPKVAAAAQEHIIQSAPLANARTAVAIERWRLRHPGRLPDSLAELVPDFLPELPQDPCDGQPLRYRKLARGYLVYSVGLDFTDDGGAGDLRGESPGTDATFIMER